MGITEKYELGVPAALLAAGLQANEAHADSGCHGMLIAEEGIYEDASAILAEGVRFQRRRITSGTQQSSGFIVRHVRLFRMT